MREAGEKGEKMEEKEAFVLGGEGWILLIVEKEREKEGRERQY